MKLINLIQGGNEWKSWRKTRITATSASIIMQHNAWKTPLDLYNEIFELTKPQEASEIMLRGNLLEPDARALFIEHTKIDMIPIVCESDKYYWMAASLDGWNEETQSILEIKSCNEKTHLMALKGIIPVYYEDQIQHQLAVTQGSICYYMTYRPEYTPNFAVVEVYPENEYIELMIKKEKHFYEHNMCNMIPPDGAWKFSP